ncbi:MAG: hypothetical protein AAGD32_11070 [Planctomycetota bacterium]
MTGLNTPAQSKAVAELGRLAAIADRAGREVSAVAWAPKVRIALLTLATFAALC